MKKLYLLLLTLAFLLPTMAEEHKERVAVFDPTGPGIDEGTRIAAREIISSAIVNSGKYNIVERSMLEKVMEEQSFSNSGAVDDTQATEIGKLAGANKVVISILTTSGRRMVFSIKMIDVKTANVEKQKIKAIYSGELLDIVEPVTLELIGEKSIVKVSQDRAQYTPTPQPVQKVTKPVTTQSTTQKPSANQVVNRYLAKQGYRGFASFDPGYFVSGIGGIALSTTHGYQLSHKAFIGGGIALDIVSDMVCPAFFAAFRGNVGENVAQFTYGARLGFQLVDEYFPFLWNFDLGLRIGFSPKFGMLITPDFTLFTGSDFFDFRSGIRIGFEF